MPLDADRNQVLVSSRTEQALRFGFAAVAVAALFAVRWDAGLDHFDFRVWSTADVLLDGGLNPYDSEILNRSLVESFPPEVGEVVDPLHLFNPPTWITQVRVMGTSALVMSLLGGLALFASIVALAKDAALDRTLGYLFGASYFLYLTPSMTTFRLGQTGLFLAGLVGLRLLLIGTRFNGVPVALMTFKPHLAVAAGISELPGPRRRTLIISAVTTFSVLVVAQLIQDGPSPWLWWVESLGKSRSFGTLTDMSFRTFSQHIDVDAVVGFPSLIVAMVIAGALSIRWKNADQRLLVLMNLAIVAYLSGHAFAHDWLWLPLVPVVCRWSLPRTLTVSIMYGTIHTYFNAMSVFRTPVGPKSLLGMAACLYLIDAARRSASSTPPPDDRTTAVKSSAAAQGSQG